MMGLKKLTVVVPIVVATSLVGVVVTRAAGPRKGHADLSGFDEAPLTLSSPGSGSLDIRISKDGGSLDYTLSYEGLTTHVLFSHIHLGRPAIAAGIMVFLCTNGTPPMGAPVPPTCPEGGGTVSGTLTAADVIGPSAQGVGPGEFTKVVDALRAEAAYGNVHTMAFPGGEIRGQISFQGKDKGKDKHKDDD
jgi:CHRD domain-containing protein